MGYSPETPEILSDALRMHRVLRSGEDYCYTTGRLAEILELTRERAGAAMAALIEAGEAVEHDPARAPAYTVADTRDYTS